MVASNQIHKTAIVHQSVKLGKANIIGPYCIIESGSVIGDNNYFNSHVNIGSNVKIGNHNQFYPGVCIGQCGEMGAKGDQMKIDAFTKIGDYNTFRENVCMHAPVYNEHSIVGMHCYIMNNSYLAHDVTLGNYVNLSAGVKLGGRVTIESHSNLGLNATVHQRCTIGQSAMVGMSTVITKAIPPFMVVAGNPSRLLKLNVIGLERRAFDTTAIDLLNANLVDVLKGNVPATNVLIKKILDFLGRYEAALVEFKKLDDFIE